MLTNVYLHTCLPVSARQVILFFFLLCDFFFLWEEGDRHISGDDSPVFCESAAESVFHPFLSLEACIQNKKWKDDGEEKKGKIGC